jgi:hypothetical protein
MSVFSYSLATTFFCLKQFDNMLSPSPPERLKAPVIESLDALTSATTAQLGETLKDTFHAADNLQRGLVELTFSMIFPFAGSILGNGDSKDLADSPSAGEPQLWTEAVHGQRLRHEIRPMPLSVVGRIA